MGHIDRQNQQITIIQAKMAQPNQLQKSSVPTTPTIPPIQNLLIICCKSHLSAEDTQFLISELSSLDHEPNNNKTWQDFLNLVSVHGVLPLAYQAIYKYAKDAIASENFNILKQSYMATVGRNMLMSAELIKVMALLEENGIKALTFKGPALAQMAYGVNACQQANPQR